MSTGTTATATALQFEANRANSLLSTGPRTDAGKLASSRNACSHGLTTRDALLPTEDLAAYHEHHNAYVDHFRPAGPLDIEAVTEIADLRWRLRRVPVYEAQLISLEIHRLKTDADLKPLIKDFDSESQFLALAFSRLIETKTLTNLLNLESRLARRIDKLQAHLEFAKRDRADQEMQARLRAARAERSTVVAISKPIEEPEEIENPQNEANSTPPPVDPVELAPSKPQPPQPIRANHKVGRNEPCPCGSGLKFKRCCLQRTPNAISSHA